MTIDDPKFIASWQKVKECLKCLDADQVERLYSKEHFSPLEFNQALADELRLKGSLFALYCLCLEGGLRGSQERDLRD